MHLQQIPETTEMAERISAIPGWAWIAGAVLILLSVVIGYRMVQTEHALAAAQIELESSKKAADKAKAESGELQVKLERATTTLKSAESRLAETQARLDGAENDLASAKNDLANTKQLSDQIKTQIDSLEENASSLTSELRKADGQRIELQLKLDEAKEEIARLKRERLERHPTSEE
jgi:chromosome segregation protein